MKKSAISPIFLWILSAAFVIMTARAVFAAEERGSLYKANGKRDPFVSLVVSGMKQNSGLLATVETVDQIHVEGIVTDPNPANSVVVANGSMLKAGDEIGFVKVLEIRPNGAKFSVNGIEGFRPLYREEEKE